MYTEDEPIKSLISEKVTKAFEKLEEVKFTILELDRPLLKLAVVSKSFEGMIDSDRHTLMLELIRLAHPELSTEYSDTRFLAFDPDEVRDLDRMRINLFE